MLAAHTADYVCAVAGTGPDRRARCRDAKAVAGVSWSPARSTIIPISTIGATPEKLQAAVLALLAEKKEIDKQNLIRLGGSGERG